MNNPIITTKGTTKSYRAGILVMALMDLVIGLVIFAVFYNYYEMLGAFRGQEALQLGTTALVIFIIIAFIEAFYGATQAISYVDVYEDKMVGKGIQNIMQPVDFSLKYDQIVNVTVGSLKFIYITTNGGKFKIVTDKETAAKILQYYTDLKNGITTNA